MTDRVLGEARVVRIAMRLVFLLGAAAGLALVCRQGASLFAVGMVFVVYVVAATLWVRGQHQASVDAAQTDDDFLRPWTFPFTVSVAALGAGLILVWAGFAKDVSS